VSERNLERSAFLKSRRQRLTAEEVGLPPSTHRRGSTLRREDVAWLADVGITWYTWLEQGRPMKMAAGTLDRVAGALKLDPSECEYLRRLMHPARTESPHRDSAVAARIQALIESYTAGCAFVIGPRWDVLFWNRNFGTLFEMRAVGEADGSGFERNGLWMMFMSERAKALFPDWRAIARRMVATFRFEQADYGGDGGFTNLIAALSRSSPEFVAIWEDIEVLSLALWSVSEIREPATRRIVEYETVTLRIAESPDQTLVFYVRAIPATV
jgi:hypothetical protein